MKNNLFCIFIFLLCINCRNSKTQSLKYDCQLFKGEFNEWEYISGTSLEPTFMKFTTETSNGIYFINKFLGSDKFYRAIMLMKENDKAIITNLLKNGKSINLSDELKKRTENILLKVEKGSFRQACFNSPSEGSLSLLLVKIDGDIVLKYEARHHDYSHLNKNEKEKLKNALELIRILIDNEIE